jgi:hypothetical protein
MCMLCCVYAMMQYAHKHFSAQQQHRMLLFNRVLAEAATVLLDR